MIEIFVVSSTEELAGILMQFKEYKTVTDVGASMISGFGKIIKVEVIHDMKTIELIFD